jgi:rubrerythrin
MIIIIYVCAERRNTSERSVIMVSGKEDLLQSLMEAFLMEKGTREFYSMASLKAIHGDAKEMFRELSAWEEQHMEYIQSLYLAIQDDRDVEGFEAFTQKTHAPVTESGIPVKDLEAKFQNNAFVDDSGALDMALEMEGKAYNLYRGLSEKASDLNARAVFKEMMGQELKHIDYLKGMRTKLAETP